LPSQAKPSVPNAADDWKWRGPHGLELAIINFKLALPGWWFTVGECQVSADASCGPTRESEHLALIRLDKRFDDGFHADLPQPASMADALRNVMAQAASAIEAATAGETPQSGSTEGESATRQGDAQTTGPSTQGSNP
jgi:hypothetical protein